MNEAEREIRDPMEGLERAGGDPGLSVQGRRRDEPLALWLRATLFLVGWLLVLVGIAGLVLPGIQGVLTLLAGAAVLSLGSELAYKVLRFSLQRWPRLWGRVARWRRRLRRQLERLGGGGRPSS